LPNNESRYKTRIDQSRTSTVTQKFTFNLALNVQRVGDSRRGVCTEL